MKIFNVAIDGPCGAGKSTIAKIVAQKLGVTYLDTGAMYRAVAVLAIESGIDLCDPIAIEKILFSAKIDVAYDSGEQKVFLDGKDVSVEIRQHHISKAASDISKHSCVRLYLVEMQRKIARSKSVVVDGRDIGSFVLPNADVKIYLTASAEIRAERRYKELISKGENADFDQILRDVNERDYSDMNRDFAPLVKCNDAILIDSSKMSVDDVAQKIIGVIKNVI